MKAMKSKGIERSLIVGSIVLFVISAFFGCSVQHDEAKMSADGGAVATTDGGASNATATANGGNPNSTSGSSADGEQSQAQGQVTNITFNVYPATPPPSDAGTPAPIPTPDAGTPAPDAGPTPTPDAGTPPSDGPTVPTWTCDPLYYGDGACDCGCGIPDPDCGGAGCTGPGCSADACEYCYDPISGQSPLCGSAPTPPLPIGSSYLPDVVRSPAPGVVEFSSLYVSDASCGLLYGDLPGIGWDAGTSIKDPNGDGYMTHTMSSDSAGWLTVGRRYELEYSGESTCGSSVPIGAAQFGSHCTLKQMHPNALKYIYCQGFDPAVPSCVTKKGCGIFLTADSTKKMVPLGVPSFSRMEKDTNTGQMVQRFYGSPGYISSWSATSCDWSHCVSQ